MINVLSIVLFQEILEKILKPVKVTKTIVKPSALTSSNAQSTKIVPKNVFQIEEPKVEIEEMKEDASNDDHGQIDYFGDDIDFSGLENGETKLEENVTAEIKAPVQVTQPESTEVKLKSEVKSTNIFENICPNWDNAYNMEDDDDADLLSAVADEKMVIDEKPIDMKFWYWDAWEDPSIPGQIFLFGKIACDSTRSTEYKSICVKVENVEHCIYVLPREFV